MKKLLRRFVSTVGENNAVSGLQLVLALAVGVYFRIPVLLVSVAGAAFVLVHLHFKHRYRETTCTPLPVAELPRRARDYFEQHTFEFEQCGFTQIGDFRVDKRLGPSHIRAFVHRSLPVFAEISDNRRAYGRNSYCVYSVVEDGTLIETTRRSGAGVPAIANIHFVFATGEPPRGVLEQHLATIGEYEDNGLRMLPLEASDLEQVLRYGYDLVYWHFYQEGFLGRPPWLDECRSRSSAPPDNSSAEDADLLAVAGGIP